ncbi:glutathione S-transferase [Marinomonas algarum]|uniref:glutathione transferase n=1 Tax=Marinomonas algarum TaxID=2883105 RepID=A0A9X1IPF9_9GAMM|nr:glutathione S-transferase [Marinomonas algarum]MCB5161498.1 glutathione S-transferase [Marinomonas algarum]
MITVHHLENSRSQRILWLLEELGQDYNIIEYKRDSQTSEAPAALKKVHPLGKSPVITDSNGLSDTNNDTHNDGSGDLVTVAESGAIIDYLIDRYDSEQRLKPTRGQALLDYRYWLHFAEGSMMPLLVMKLVLAKIPESPMPFFVKPIAKVISCKVQEKFIQPRLQPQMQLIEQTLGQHTWLTGEQLTAADIQMSFPLMASAFDWPAARYPNITRYIKQIEALPAYKTAVEKGGALSTL